MTKTRVLFASDSLNNTTGFANVASALLRRFYYSGKYEIGYATISGGDTTPDGLLVHGEEFETISKNIKIFNTQIMDKKRAPLFDKAIEVFKPHIVISILDPWVLDQIALSKYKRSFFWACFLTIETPEYPKHVIFPNPANAMIRKSIAELIGTADLVIPCTNMGKGALKKLGLDPVDHIYLGLDVDKEVKEDISKKEAFGVHVPDDAFVFMTVGVNSERKKISKIVESFYLFKKKMTDPHNKYRLYIHSDLDRQQAGTDVKSMIGNLKLGESVLYPRSYKKNIGISKAELYRRYKASDCYIGLAAGEGFGLGYVEAMLHKKPVIYIDYGGHTEFCQNIGLPVKIAAFDYAINAYIKFALADVEDCARQMSRVATDKKLRDINLEKGYEFVQSIDWNNQARQFIRTLEKEFQNKVENNFVNLPLKRII